MCLSFSCLSGAEIIVILACRTLRSTWKTIALHDSGSLACLPKALVGRSIEAQRGSRSQGEHYQDEISDGDFVVVCLFCFS